MKDIVSSESYVERYAREHKLGKYAESETGIPVEKEMGIPSDAEKGIPVKDEKNILGSPDDKEGRKNGKDTRSERHEAPTE